MSWPPRTDSGTTMKFHEAALFAYALAPELVTAPAPALTGPGAAEAGDDAQVAH